MTAVCEPGLLRLCVAGTRLRRLVHRATVGLSIANVIFSVYKVVTYLTRLETRTKESNMYASHWVSKPKGAMKVKQACLSIHDP